MFDEADRRALPRHEFGPNVVFDKLLTVRLWGDSKRLRELLHQLQAYRRVAAARHAPERFCSAELADQNSVADIKNAIRIVKVRRSG